MTEGTNEAKFAHGKTEEGADWRIHYTVRGSGPALILLHGGGPGASGMSNYDKNIGVLSAHCTCYIIDFPGWGQSSKNLQSFGAAGPFQNGGRAVKAFMDTLGIAKAHLMGNSFGGSAALSLAMEHPERVDRLVLMGPGGGAVPGATGPTEGIMQLLTYYQGEGPSIGKLQAFIKNLVYDASLITPELLKIRFDASNDPEIIANPPLKMSPSGSRPPATLLTQDPRLKDTAHPALFVWGLQDRVNPYEGMTDFRVMPNADFVLLSRCGHWAQWERPAEFNELVLGFLGRAANNAGAH